MTISVPEQTSHKPENAGFPGPSAEGTANHCGVIANTIDVEFTLKIQGPRLTFGIWLFRRVFALNERLVTRLTVYSVS